MTDQNAASVPPCIHDHAPWKLVSMKFAGARISIASCAHCGWVDTEDAIEQALALSAPPPPSAPTPAGDTIRDVIKRMRSKGSRWPHSYGSEDVIYANTVEDWADELEAALAPPPAACREEDAASQR